VVVKDEGDYCGSCQAAWAACMEER